MLYLKTDLNDTIENIFNDSNIEEVTKFNTTLSCHDKKIEDISCHFWKNTDNIVYIFCQLNEQISCFNYGIE